MTDSCEEGPSKLSDSALGEFPFTDNETGVIVDMASRDPRFVFVLEYDYIQFRNLNITVGSELGVEDHNGFVTKIEKDPFSLRVFVTLTVPSENDWILYEVLTS